MEATAILRTVRLSPQKGRLIADMIRGLPVERALEILQFKLDVLWSMLDSMQVNLGIGPKP